MSRSRSHSGPSSNERLESCPVSDDLRVSNTDHSPNEMAQEMDTLGDKCEDTAAEVKVDVTQSVSDKTEEKEAVTLCADTDKTDGDEIKQKVDVTPEKEVKMCISSDIEDKDEAGDEDVMNPKSQPLSVIIAESVEGVEGGEDREEEEESLSPVIPIISEPSSTQDVPLDRKTPMVTVDEVEFSDEENTAEPKSLEMTHQIEELIRRDEASDDKEQKEMEAEINAEKLHKTHTDTDIDSTTSDDKLAEGFRPV